MATNGGIEIDARTRVRLCGEPALEIDGRDAFADLPEGQGRSLLTYLLAHRDDPTDRDALVDVVWPDGPPENAKAYLRVIVSRLRRTVAPAELEGRDRLRLALPEPVWVDFEEAAAALARARAAAAEQRWQDTLREARIALELLRPGFVPGVHGGWVDDRRGEVEEHEIEALDLSARAGLELGGSELPAAQRVAGELVARSPFRESSHRLLMEVMAAGGNVAEALQAYEELRVLLRDELGVAPAPDIQALHKKLLDGETERRASLPSIPVMQPPAERVPLPMLLSPRDGAAFVGRAPEFEILRSAWADACSGTRRLVVVCGEPGIGKTRMSSELAREAHSDGTVLYAGCQEDALVSYQPFVEALRHYARGSAPIALGPGGAELARLVPELADALPPDSESASEDPEARRFLMFEAVSTLLTEAANRTPILLVLDDLHWADRPTLQLLRHVVRAHNQSALLILGTYREAEITPEHPLFELLADLRRDKLFERVSLSGLDEDSAGELIHSHAGYLAPSSLVHTVHAETAGNPFFIEEVMRHLIETGVVSEEAGRWTSALRPEEIGVPEGVKEVLVRRVGRLSETCRLVLSDAAVLGRDFRLDVLPAMSEVSEDAVIAALEEALEAQLIVEEAESAGTVYAFRHALVRETLYGGLSAPRRQRIHARAAEAIEAMETAEVDAQIAALAVHYRLAGPVVDPAKGIEYSLRAGDRARQMFAWEETWLHWDGALTLMDRARTTASDRVRLLVALADISAIVGEIGRQIEYLDRALTLYSELGDEEHAAQVHSRLGMAYSLVDTIYAEHFDLRRAFRHFDAARVVLDRGPVRKARGHLDTGVGTALTYGLRIQPGMDAAKRAMDIGEELGDEALWTAACQAYSWHNIVAGNLKVGFESVQRGFEVADRGQWPFLAWMATTIGGQMQWAIGDPDAAQRVIERPFNLPYTGHATFRQQLADAVGRCHVSRGEMAEARELVSDAKPVWVTHSLKPLIDLWDGNWDEVTTLAAQVLATSRRTGNRWDEWASHHLAARVQALRGELAPAADALERARRIVVDGGARNFETWVLPDLARVEVELEHIGDARRNVDRVREILADGEDWRGRGGVAEIAEAVVLSAEGHDDEAVACFARAAETLRRYRLRPDEADCLHQWALALTRAGDRAAASEKLDQAEEIYRDGGAGAAWLARIEAARAAAL